MTHILVVIPCLNEEAHIERLIRHLIAHDKNNALRIVICDGGSTDCTPIIAKNLAQECENIIFLQNPKRIQSAALNLAVTIYGQDTKWLIRLDAHAQYPNNYCQILLEEAQATQADCVVISMNTRGQDGFQKSVAIAQNSKLGNGGASHRNIGQNGMWVDHGHHALMRISAFRAVDGYDENFSHNEDAELDIRLRAAGYKIWLTGKTTLTYFPRSAPLALFQQYYNFGYGRAQTILKHRIRPKIRQMIPVAVVPAAFVALASPIIFIVALPLILWASICLLYGLMLAIKAKEVGIIASGAAAMIMHCGWSLGFWKALVKNITREFKTQ